MKLDLHTHSNLSDGAFTPEEIVDMGVASGFSVLAITDHDSISSWDRASEAARGRGIAILPGVEVSAAWENEELHILGYFPAGVPRAFREFLGRALARREERMRTMVDNVRRRGVPVDFEDVRKLAAGESLSRAHLAQLMVARGHAATIDQAFEEHLGYHVGNIPLSLTPVADAIRIIAESGGLAVWAHPPAAELEERLSLMVKWGLHGVEAFRRRTHGVKTARLVELGDSYGLFTTAGSDWHGHRREPLTDELAFPPYRLRPFLKEFGLEHLAA